VVVACLSLFLCVCMCVYVLAASPQPPPRVTRNRLQSLPNTAGASVLNSKFLPQTSRQRIYLYWLVAEFQGHQRNVGHWKAIINLAISDFPVISMLYFKSV